jgi:integral membrane protein
MSPRTLFRGLAILEACTWAGLLAGMLLKYGTDTTEAGVQIFGPIHGVAFIAYCLAAVLVAVDQRWRAGRLALALLSAIPPFFTLLFEWHVERRQGLSSSWRLAGDEPTGVVERLAAWLIRRPGQGLAAGVAAVAVLTAVALVVGPPVG